MNGRSFFIHASIIGGFFLFDQLTKLFLTDFQRSFELINLPFLNIRLEDSLNTGFAFGVPAPYWVIIGVISLLLILLISYWKGYVLKGASEAYWMNLILAGALGNLIDRIFFGGVVDWIEITIDSWSWSSINLADIFILIGALGWLYASHPWHKKETV